MKQLKSKLIPDEFWIQEVRQGFLEPNRRYIYRRCTSLRELYLLLNNPKDSNRKPGPKPTVRLVKNENS